MDEAVRRAVNSPNQTYQRLQPRLAQAAKARRWSKVAELYPRVRDAKTKMLRNEIRAERKERSAA